MDKMIDRKFDEFTIDDHQTLSYVDLAKWTKKFWTHINYTRQVDFFWPEAYSSDLLRWNSEMIKYHNYMNNVNIKGPLTIVRFTYTIIYENEDISMANGKFNHHYLQMTHLKWAKIKTMLKERIKDVNEEENKANDKIKPIKEIKMYGINVKKDLEYESDDDAYSFVCDEIPDNESIEYEIPKIPENLLHIGDY